MIGRRKQYTQKGISRIPCSRCGQPSVHQWQICALNNRWLGVCIACDNGINRLVLDYMRIPNAESLAADYEKRNK